MTTWAGGYVTDIEYTSHFYRETAPLHLNFAIQMQGFRPPSIGEGTTYCELACGQGLGTNILAAANPQVKFWGVDFNPAHIDNARRLAAAAGLQNVAYLDNSFEQMITQPPGDLPQFDYIVLHGIYSWVSEENRRFIVRFIDRHLKPGGVAYVSYNCLPGWSATAPLQRLVREYATRHPDRSDHQVEAAFKFAKQVIDGKAGYFQQNPIVAKRIEKLPMNNKHYLAHEYLNGHWHPLYHLDVAAEMSDARLSYVGSATLVENLDRVSIPAGMIEIVRDSRDTGWTETLRDYARNQQFRRDIFMRGATRVMGPEQTDRLGNTRLALVVPHSTIKYEIPTPLGEIKADQATSKPILDALAEGTRTIRDFATLPSLQGTASGTIVGTVALLVHSGQIHPVQTFGSAKQTAPGRALNKAIVGRLMSGELLTYLAMPAAGTGTRATFPELLLLDSLQDGGPLDPAKIALASWTKMERTGRRLIREGKRVESKDENVALLQKEFTNLTGTLVPVWKAVGML